MSFPTSYDDDSTLLGDLQDQKNLVLNFPCADVDTRLFFESIAEVSVPTYLRIQNELIRVTGLDEGDQSLTVVRGAGAANYLKGETASMVVVGEHLTTVRDRAVVTQKYQGLVGLDAAKPASPEVSMIYIATDTKKVYACTTSGVWSLLGGATTHADVQREGETDDHAQYFTLARLLAWHNAIVGEHVTDGDNHDHRYGGVSRIATGTVGALGNKSVGHIRLATDTGELYLSQGSAVWVSVTGAPSGAIAVLLEADAAIYGGACPPGWSRYAALDGKYPKGLPSGGTTPGTGGTGTHTHTYTQVPAHVHTIPAMNPTSGSGGSHSHSFAFSTLASGTGIASTVYSGGGSVSTSSGGSHTHTFTYPAGNTASAGGGASGTSSSVSTEPPYQEVIFCKKD